MSALNKFYYFFTRSLFKKKKLQIHMKVPRKSFEWGRKKKIQSWLKFKVEKLTVDCRRTSGGF